MQEAVYLALYNKDFENCFHMAWVKREVDQFQKKKKKENRGRYFAFELTRSYATGSHYSLRATLRSSIFKAKKKHISLTPRGLKIPQGTLE